MALQTAGLLLILLTGCDDGAWSRAQLLEAQAVQAQGAQGWAHPLWVDAGRECSRVMPWHPGWPEARALRAEIEAGRLEAGGFVEPAAIR